MFIFEALIQLRQNLLRHAATLDAEQLNRIPAGFNNNIAWHIGHMMVSQQLLCYARSGVTPLLSAEWLDKYRKGTDPKSWDRPVTLAELQPLFLSTAEAFEADYQKGLFGRYESYTTSTGAVLDTIDEAVTYSYGHENMHFGNVQVLLKLIRS